MHVTLADRIPLPVLVVVGSALSHTGQIRKSSARRIDNDTRPGRCPIGGAMFFHIESSRQRPGHPDAAEIRATV